jgi:hypothetical protein
LINLTKHKKNRLSRYSQKKTAFLWGKFFTFFHLESRRRRKKKILITQESLGGFLQDYDLASKHSLGKSYLRRRKWVAIFGYIKKIFTKIILFASKTTLRLTVTFVIFVFLGGIIPTILASPQFKTVTSAFDWELGSLTGVTTNTSQDAIQLAPQGSWDARLWAAPPDTIYFGSASKMAWNYLYVMRGYADKEFWRYDTVNDRWETLPDLPFPANYGADMTFIPGATEGTGKIYAIFGGYLQKFYEFNIATQSWKQLPDLRDSTYYGSSIETDGADVYFLRGNASGDFYKYHVNADDPYWQNLSGITSPATVNTGGDLVYGHDGYLYAIRGSNTASFYRFLIPATDDDMGSWELMANTLANFNGEQKGVYWDGGGAGHAKSLFFLRSTNTATFYRYQITCDDGSDGTCPGQKNTWFTVDNAPGNNNYSSLTYNETDKNIYVIRASNGSAATTDLWKYDPSGAIGHQWVGPEQVQDGAGTLRAVGTGGDLIWNGKTVAEDSSVFAVSGNSVYFNEYDVSQNDWITRGSIASVTADATGTINEVSGVIYYPRGTSVYTFDTTQAAPGSWGSSVPTGMPTVGNGGGIIYNGSHYYVMPGGGASPISSYFYDCGTSFSACARISGATNDIVVGGVAYFANVGARMVSPGTYFSEEVNSTDIYLTLGDGETTFLKYSNSTGSWVWSKLASTPFAQYYGTTMTYFAGKIYALAGYYKDEIWEYDISNNSWRKLPATEKYTFGRGVWQGANIEYSGGSSLYALIGNYGTAQDQTSMRHFQIGAHNFVNSSVSAGTYISQAMDLSTVSSWEGISANVDIPLNTGITFSTMTDADNANWPDETNSSNWHEVDNAQEEDGLLTADISSSEGTRRYIKIKINFVSTDGQNTPTVYDYTFSYNHNSQVPTNPSSLQGYSQQVGGFAIESEYSEGYPYEHPYFSWLGMTDNGSGINGYYVCFDSDSNCSEPVTGSNWSFQSGATYLANTPLSTGDYHLKIKTKDNEGKMANEIWDAFVYNYAGVSTATGVDPLHSVVTSTNDFTSGGSSSDVAVFGTGDAASLKLSPVSGFWNQNRLSTLLGNVYGGGELALGRCKDDTDVEPPYQFNDNHCLYTMAGNNLKIFYRYEIETDTWTTRATTPYNSNTGGSLVEGPEGYLYATRGAGNEVVVNAAAFWTYNILNNSWVELGNAPKSFAAGSNLTYDGSRYIYAMPGTDDVLLIYDTCNGVSGCTGGWKNPYSPASIENADFGNPYDAASGQFTGEGGDSVYDERNNMYVIQGNQYSYFAKYSFGNDADYGEVKNTWTPLTPAPEGFYNGGSLTYDSETDSIYAITGNNAAYNNFHQSFLKYDIKTDDWSNLPDAPSLVAYPGASLVAYDGYIYFMRGGNTNLFYRFNVAENSWETPQRGLFGPEIPKGNNNNVDSFFPFTNGAFTVDDDSRNLYMFRGGYDNTFEKYDVSTGASNELARLPVGAFNGASAAYVDGSLEGGSIYYVPGGLRTRRTDTKSPYFFRYDVNKNSWSNVLSNLPSLQIATGSSMTYDGSRYIYLTQGGANTVWWKYDTKETDTPVWLAMTGTGSCNSNDGSKILYYKDASDNEYIYKTQGGSSTSVYRYKFGTGWTNIGPLPGAAGAGSAMMDGGDGYIYVTRGGGNVATGNEYYRFNASQTGPVYTWENLNNTTSKVPAVVTTGGSGTNVSNRNWITSGNATYTYSSFQDGLFNYVVSSSANQVGFSKTGNYVSGVIDTHNSVYRWGNISIDYTLPDEVNNFLTFETRTSESGSLLPEDEADWSTWTPVSNEHVYGNRHVFNINSDPRQYIQVRIGFASADQIFSPRVDDFSIYYYQDIEQPNSPSAVTAYSKEATSAEDPRVIITNVTDEEYPTGQNWYGYDTPYFEWPVAGEANGASDNPNPGGSGISGYYVCFGTEEECPDAIANGDFQEGNTFSAPTLLPTDSGKKYYLKIAAVDNVGLPSESYTGFIYQLDKTAPTLPTNISANPSSYSSSSKFTWSWLDDAEDDQSGIDRFQYRLGNETPDTWHELTELGTLSQIVEPYQPNENEFYLKVLDVAGNETVSGAKYFFWSGGAASKPIGLEVNPSNEDNVTNNFTFTWHIPESYAGDSSKITYFYSVNYDPTPFNTVETTATSAGPGPFATQFGKNTFHIVAMSEGGSKTNPDDVDWEHPADVFFYARTTAPGPPLNAQAFDTSDREAAEYSIALKWSAPTTYDEGNFAGYAIFRSDDGINFGDEIAMTTGSAFVDTNLESKLYYYYVKSKDKTNNYSIPTSIVSLTPTGRYTTAPTLVGVPKVTVQSFAANFTWATNRVASSFVEYGTSSSFGKTNGQVDSLTDHMVDVTGLSAGTKYFYRVKYIDPDGNIGMSDILNFITLPPPTISEVLITNIVLNEAIVSWETNVSAACTLSYGAGTNKEESGGASHVQRINNLSADSTYTLKISCVDADLNEFSSDEYTFVTPKQPTASDVTVQNEENVDLPTIVIRYLTNVPTTTLVYFKSSEESSPHTFLTSEKVTEHEARIEGLDPAKEYTLSITGTDDNGINITPLEQKITTKSDSRPPKVVTNRSLGKVLGRGNNSQANVYIKIETDEETNVKVKYAKGVVTSTLEQTVSSDGLNTYHLITIPAEPGQVYSYEAECYDAVGNLTKTEITSVVVEKAKASATEVITGTFASRFGWMSNLWAK